MVTFYMYQYYEQILKGLTFCIVIQHNNIWSRHNGCIVGVIVTDEGFLCVFHEIENSWIVSWSMIICSFCRRKNKPGGNIVLQTGKHRSMVNISKGNNKMSTLDRFMTVTNVLLIVYKVFVSDIDTFIWKKYPQCFYSM